MSKRYVVSILLILIYVCSSIGASVKISVSPPRGKSNIDVGDIFYLNIIVSDIKESPGRPNLPGAKLNYFDKTGEQSSFSSINGVTSQSFTYTYTATLRAEQEGSFNYGPIILGGVKSNQIKYSIGKKVPVASSNATQNSQVAANDDYDDSKPKFIGKGDSNLFLRATVSESTAFEQEALVYTVKLYSTYDAIKFIGATSAPKFDGFVVEESKDISTSLSFENYQGKTYATAIIARYIIFPQMPGNLKIIGNTYTISVDRREYYHDAFWGNMSYSTPLQLNVTPNDLIINVKSLPEPKPADFSGGVGNFRISSSLNGSSFKTNQAASIVYNVEGTGNIKYIQLPDLSTIYPPEIEVYTPKTTQDVSVGSSNVSGSVKFDYSFMPMEEGNFIIPDIKLVYFNPATGKYETSIAKGYSIKVGKGVPSNGNNIQKRFNNSLQQVNYLSLKNENRPVIFKFIYWLWFIIPSALLIIILLIYRNYNASHSDMIAFNSRRADKIARKRLRKAAAAMKKSDSELFYTELLAALWGYLGDKLKMPPSELMRDNVRQVMLDHNVPDRKISEFIDIIDEAEFAKFSSANSTKSLSEVYKEATEVINNLEKEFKK